MNTEIQNTSVSKKILWTGWIITILVGLFLLFDSIIKFVQPEQVKQINAQLGYSEGSIFWIGLTLLICTILYLIPKTAVFGAILLTAYLGGATNTHVRVGQPFYFPIVFGILVWLGIYFREGRLKALLPLRK